ncbi:MAG: alpha/beta-type small acid-soluble spore protein [Thermaerobacter sp.]|nr:spore protein [Bacillota bacterium]
MATGQRNNRIIVPQARQALDRLKYETASEIGLPNYQGYLGDVPSRLNGAVGGNMVRKMIRFAEQQMAQGQTVPTLGATGAGAQPAGQAFGAQVPGQALPGQQIPTFGR